VIYKGISRGIAQLNSVFICEADGRKLTPATAAIYIFLFSLSKPIQPNRINTLKYLTSSFLTSLILFLGQFTPRLPLKHIVAG